MNLLADQAKMLTDIGGVIIDGPKVSASPNEMRNKGKSCTNLVKSVYEKMEKVEIETDLLKKPKNRMLAKNPTDK